METLRRTMLFIPGGNEKMAQKALALAADSLIIDLEDSVAPQAKTEARQMVREFIGNNDFGGKEVMVRVNSVKTEFGEDDLEVIASAQPDALVVPKVENGLEIKELDSRITKIEEQKGLVKESIKLMALIETPLGLINVEEIAKSSQRLTGLLFGAGDFIKETRGQLTREGWELYYPRTKILVAARAMNIDAIDSPYFDVKDLEGCKASARLVKSLGYDGKSAIHPKQVEEINKVFTPTLMEIEHAKKIIEVYQNAEAEGKGATQLDGQLIEHVHATIARRTLKIAEKAGLG